MRGVLVCPGERPAVAFLAQAEPLVALPVLGQTLLESWLEHGACLGWKEVKVLATDRPEQVRAVVGEGKRWGLEIEVVPELNEPAVAEAGARHGVGGAALQSAQTVVLIDHLPGLPQHHLFSSYAAWFHGLTAWLPHLVRRQRLGLREIRPGVWAGLRSRVHERAQLEGPCWLGESVVVGPEAMLGPNAMLEDRVVVERAAAISNSVVGPETFVGAFTKLEHSVAWGNTLINWRTGSCTIVPDAFLLSALNPRTPSRRSRRLPGWTGTWEGWRNALTRPLQFLARSGLGRS